MLEIIVPWVPDFLSLPEAGVVGITAFRAEALQINGNVSQKRPLLCCIRVGVHKVVDDVREDIFFERHEINDTLTTGAGDLATEVPDT